jgi:hypothetical protein
LALLEHVNILSFSYLRWFRHPGNPQIPLRSQKIAAEAGIPQEFVLAVAAEETYWGERGIVLSSNNFFGLHVISEKDTNHFANQTGVYTTKPRSGPPAYVAQFSAATGF